MIINSPSEEEVAKKYYRQKDKRIEISRYFSLKLHHYKSNILMTLNWSSYSEVFITEVFRTKNQPSCRNIR